MLARARVLRAAGRAGGGKDVALSVAAAAERAGAARVAAEAQLLAGQLSEELKEVGAEDRLRLAIAAADAVGDDESRARGWLTLVVHYAERHEFPASVGAEQQAEAIISRLGSPQLLDAELFKQRGKRLIQQDDAEGAELAFEHSRALLLKHRPKDDALVMMAENNYLASLGDGDSAKALAGLRALALLREQVLGSNHPETAVAHENVGALLLSLKQCPEAEREVRGALAARFAAGEPNLLRLGKDQTLLARVLECLGRLDDAIAAQRAGVAQLSQGGEPEASRRAELSYLAELLKTAKRSPAEVKEVEDAIKQPD